jgi:hypothetical protein
VGALFQDKAATKNSLIIPAVLVGGRKKKKHSLQIKSQG